MTNIQIRMRIKTLVTTQHNKRINVTTNKLYYKAQVYDDGDRRRLRGIVLGMVASEKVIYEALPI